MFEPLQFKYHGVASCLNYLGYSSSVRPVLTKTILKCAIRLNNMRQTGSIYLNPRTKDMWPASEMHEIVLANFRDQVDFRCANTRAFSRTDK